MEEVGESREKFVAGLGITPRTLERYENDESEPDASFFTRLNAKYHGKVNLDWLLAGRGGIYIGGQGSSVKAAETSLDYFDVILEKMHKQVDRIYKERNFHKLAALQSLLNLADPSSEDQ